MLITELEEILRSLGIGRAAEPTSTCKNLEGSSMGGGREHSWGGGREHFWGVGGSTPWGGSGKLQVGGKGREELLRVTVKERNSPTRFTTSY